MLSILFWLGVGLVLGSIYLHFARRGSVARERQLLAVGLTTAALIYVAFAIIGGASLPWIGVEIFGVALFGGLAIVGQRRSAVVLALGWAMHVIWDTALHVSGPGAAFTPAWYPLLCISFDLLVAGSLVLAPSRSPVRH